MPGVRRQPIVCACPCARPCLGPRAPRSGRTPPLPRPRTAARQLLRPQTFLKRMTRALGRRDLPEARRIYAVSKPSYTLDHLIR